MMRLFASTTAKCTFGDCSKARTIGRDNSARRRLLCVATRFSVGNISACTELFIGVLVSNDCVALIASTSPRAARRLAARTYAIDLTTYQLDLGVYCFSVAARLHFL